MIRLLQIEYRKLRKHKAFWILILLYSLLLASMVFGIPGLIDYLAAKSENGLQMKLFKAVVFHFPDVWQNITYVASARYFIKIIPGLIVIILITNEFSYNTIRLNIVNGMSRAEFLAGKTLIISLLAVFSTLILLFSGLYLGLAHSYSSGSGAVFGKTVFLPAYFLELLTYLIFCMFLGILFKKAGMAFIVHFVWFIAEPVLDYKLPAVISPYLPLNAMNRLIQSPNSSLIKIQSPQFDFTFQEHIAVVDTVVCLLYAIVFLALSLLILEKRRF